MRIEPPGARRGVDEFGPLRVAQRVAAARRVRASKRHLRVRAGRRLIRHARYFVVQLVESYLTRRLFAPILGRIERLAEHPPPIDPYWKSRLRVSSPWRAAE